MDSQTQIDVYVNEVGCLYLVSFVFTGFYFSLLYRQKNELDQNTGLKKSI